MIVCAYISDRGDRYLPQCKASVAQRVHGIDVSLVVDDQAHTLGLAGAVQTAWQQALDFGADYLWHQEEDFVILDDVHLDQFVYILEHAPYLAQVVLKRQPWSPEEHQAGGIIERDPAMYVERGAFGRHVTWTEHHQIFSLNPCLIPREVLELGWPDGNEAEMTDRLIEAGFRFAFFGGKTDQPRCLHVGAERAPGWKL
jgi:hypothetical protein